ncbi:MAG TPA: phosphoenolpyruvate-utilizing N-terminal domain-containing protein, partial [Patescibacteria group bacterium]|nr:phosphoenolpyruvate-utilizing N-terminal domain-containing protein [Patescibacteria group bacterium]
MSSEPDDRTLDVPPVADEQIFIGQGVSPGIAIGVAHPHDAGNVAVPEYKIAKDKVDSERARFTDAVSAASRQISKLQSKAR